MTQNNRFLSLLGLARKANKVALGYDKALESIHRGKCVAVFTAVDLSEKTRRGLIFAAEETNIKVITVSHTVFDITNAVGQKTGIVAVTDKGFADKLVLLNSQQI